MAALHIDNVPEELYARIDKLARAAGRSAAELAAEILARSVDREEQEAQLLATIRSERDQMAARGVFTTDADIRRGREWGRK
ncbi:MAG TPA: hypothetical protein VK324_02075 [Tepidisphaeraceae bacterium]|nr:hypothetical protein [Tepidisphaeraceae bacterium]